MGPVDSLVCPHFRSLAPVRFLQAEAVDPEVRALLGLLCLIALPPNGPNFEQWRGAHPLGHLGKFFFMSYVGVALSEIGREQEELGWGGSLQLFGPLSQVITKIPSKLKIYCCWGWGTASVFTAAMKRASKFISYVHMHLVPDTWMAGSFLNSHIPGYLDCIFFGCGGNNNHNHNNM